MLRPRREPAPALRVGVSPAPVAGPRRGAHHTGTRPNAASRDKIADGSGRPTRVLLVDDHAIVREGIASVLESDERLTVVGEGGDGVEALELLQQLRPDVVLMDVNMPRMNGIEATREIAQRWPGTITVGLSVQSDPPTAELMREAGAAGFVPKSGDSEEMIATILSVAARGTAASDDNTSESPGSTPPTEQ